MTVTTPGEHRVSLAVFSPILLPPPPPHALDTKTRKKKIDYKFLGFHRVYRRITGRPARYECENDRLAFRTDVSVSHRLHVDNTADGV